MNYLLVALISVAVGVWAADDVHCWISGDHTDMCMAILYGGNGDPEPVQYDDMDQPVDGEECEELPADDPDYCGGLS